MNTNNNPLSRFLAVLVCFLVWSLGSASAQSGVLGDGTTSPPVPEFPNETSQSAFNLPSIDSLMDKSSRAHAGAESYLITDISFSGISIATMAEKVQEIARETLQEHEGSSEGWSQSDILEFRDLITKTYIDAGYVNSGALIESQDISDGMLNVRIVEGRLAALPVRSLTPTVYKRAKFNETNFRYSGSRVDTESEQNPQKRTNWRPLELRHSYITSRLAPNADEVLNQIDIQKRFQNLSSDPAIQKIEAALTPGANPGEALLYLDVYEANPIWLNAEVASDRSPSIGGERAVISGGVRNLAGFGDVLSFQVGVSEGLNDATLSYNLPVGNSPVSLSVFGQYSDAEVVEEPLTNLNVLSDSTSVGLGVAYKIFDGVLITCKSPGKTLADCETGSTRSSLYDLNVSADISQKNSESELLGLPFSFSPGAVDGETENLVGSISLDGVLQSPRQVAAGRLSVSYGFETLETTNPNGPPENFVSVLSQTQYARRVFDELDHQVIARLDVQYTPDTLFSSERYAFGGIDSVRGYRKNEVLSDNAAVASVEYRMGLRSIFQGAQSRFIEDWSVGVFGDVGYGWNSELTDPVNNTLASVGLQFNFDLFDRVTGSVYYGHQLEEIPTPQDEKLQDSGFGFRLSFKGL